MIRTRREDSIGCHPHPSLRTVLGAVLVAGLLSGGVACEHDPSSAGSTSHAAPAPGVAQRLSRARLPASPQPALLTDRAWWNQPDLIDALALTGEQRAQMDALLRQSMETQRAAQQQQREQQRKLKEALEAGNWDAARQAAAAAAESMNAAWRTQTMLKIDVLALLDPNQQRLVTSQYRRVLHQTSVLSRLRGDARQRPAPTAEQPR